ncbi:MAG: class I SAM-dependent methyltransferase [Syntrophobacterales bacterium]|jgi:2-polyprenyl-3-methyl-5-hydroxy-6-metoxy-1,4-benzoquinol methylase|nr:class I SAM-dependent methyltransferase [Syntrophobacterales bacterium]
MSFYSEIADYYDLIFPPNKRHVGFIKACVEPPYLGKKILDVGSGTGGLAISMAEAGFAVEGIDYDTDMLVRAKLKVKTGSPIIFTQMDMREISSRFDQSAFDAVLSFGNTLVHLLNLGEIAKFCRNVRTVLRDDGVFLLQILNYDHILDNDVRELPLIENDAIKFDRYNKYDTTTKLIAFKTVLTVKKTGVGIINEIPLYPVRKRELEDALKTAGFTDISCYGDFNRGELKPDSLPLVVEAW